MRAERAGVALLEVLVAATVLGTAGVALASVLGQTARSMRATAASEARVERGSRMLDEASLWSAAALQAHLGQTVADSLVLVIAPLGPDLFSATVTRLGTEHVLLATTYYHPDSADAADSSR